MACEGKPAARVTKVLAPDPSNERDAVQWLLQFLEVSACMNHGVGLNSVLLIAEEDGLFYASRGSRVGEGGGKTERERVREGEREREGGREGRKEGGREGEREGEKTERQR
jgi:hypothetical protein